MDKPTDSATAHERLAALMAQVERELVLAQENAATVELDQSSVGRLSRMDALQQLAMALASIQRLAVHKRRIAAAMDRVAASTYGLCCECGGDVEAERLTRDPTTLFCAPCQSERRPGLT